MMRALAMLLLLSAFTTDATLPDPAQEVRAQGLFREVRCVVCAGQAVAESNVPLAGDLRGVIRTLIHEGKTDAEIKNYLVQRYGEEILFSPPLGTSTAFLWAAPFMLLLAGLGYFAIKRK